MMSDHPPAPARRGFLGHLAGIAAGTGILYGCTRRSEGHITTIAPPRQTEHPDAELIAACAEHARCHRVINADVSDRDCEDHPLWALYLRCESVIDNAQPRTMTGLAAKARAALLEASMPDGHESWDDGAQGWAADLVRDLVRLGGEDVA